MVAYVAFCLLSGIWLRAQGLPIGVFAGEAAVFVLPAVFYLVGRMKDSGNGFYKGFLWGLFIICGVGLLFYIWAPQFYLDYLYDWSYISLADAPTMRVRMNSVVGCTVLGSISVVGMLAGMALFKEGKNKKLGIAGFIVGLIFAFLSNQRSAMVAALLVAAYMNVLIFFSFKLFKKKYFFIEIGVIVLAIIAMLVISPGAVLKVYYRLASLPQAIGERSEQWVAAVNMMYSSWIGNGLGANGHRALGIEGVKVVADGGLVKMFCELGVVGVSIFAYLLLLIYKKSIKCFSECCVELGIISIFLLQSIGSNVFSFQLATPLFWYAVGRCVGVIHNGEDSES